MPLLLKLNEVTSGLKEESMHKAHDHIFPEHTLKHTAGVEVGVEVWPCLFVLCVPV